MVNHCPEPARAKPIETWCLRAACVVVALPLALACIVAAGFMAAQDWWWRRR